jgi:GntR family transcriptional repressor for pyruvate dehydrogenase complex
LIDAIQKKSLSDSIAQAVKEMIDRHGFGPGHKLPTINEMARQFGVGSPTIREALRKLQAVGVIEMRHGSGIYVAQNHDALFVANSVRSSSASKKVMIDLIDTRLSLEVFVAGLAATHVTDETIEELEGILERAEQSLLDTDMETLGTINMDFHRGIALASSNGVAYQVLDLLAGLFQSEQYAILEIYGSPEKDLAEHRGILDALRARDSDLSTARMKSHLEGVKAVLVQSKDADLGG